MVCRCPADCYWCIHIEQVEHREENKNSVGLKEMTENVGKETSSSSLLQRLFPLIKFVEKESVYSKFQRIERHQRGAMVACARIYFILNKSKVRLCLPFLLSFRFYKSLLHTEIEKLIWIDFL